jgi:hypothetical protein
MLALLSVWIGLAALALAVLMAVRRSLFTDVMVPLTLYSAIFALTFAGLTLWSLRKQPAAEPGVAARRSQSFVGIALGLAAITIVYLLVGFAERVPR